MADTSLVNVLIEAVYNHLIQELITDVTEEATEVGLVKIGKLQDDPTILMKNILVRESEDGDTIFKDGDYQVQGWTYEIGGGSHWWRKFRVKFELHYPPETTLDQARQYSNVIRSRAEYALDTMPIPGVTDSFGESPFMILVSESKMRQAGGDGSWIYRGELLIQFATEKLR